MSSTSLAAEGGNNAPIFAAGALIAHNYVDKFNINEPNLKKALAAIIGFRALVDIVAKGKDVDNISGACAPLAVSADLLDIASFDNVALTAFGANLCNELTTGTKDIIGKQSEVQGLPIFWAATMLAAVYKGYGAHWHVASYTATRAKGVADGIETKNFPIAETPIFVICAWAIYRTFVKNDNKMPLVSKGIMLGEAAHSAWKLVVRLLKKGQDKMN